VWKGTITRDLRSFAQVLKCKSAPMVMVPLRPTRGWSRSGFGAGRGVRGDV
jgi:hypothetical protein